MYISALLQRSTIAEANSIVGIALAICGNLLISFALNIQKLAHNKLSLEQTEIGCVSSRSSSSTYGSVPSYDYGDSPSSTDDVRYLRSKTWWLGIFFMICGEIGNFMAYGFAPASTIAPLGTTTLVSNALLAPCLLNERFRKRDVFGSLLAMIGAAGVVWSSKSHEIQLSPELVSAALTQMRSIVFYVLTCNLILLLTILSPRYGSQYIGIDLGLCALYGAYTVLATKSLSSLLNLTLYNLFTYTVSYVLILVLILTAVMQIKYLNKALQRFDSTAVIPTQFVLFTSSAIIGSAVIYRDFDNDDASHLSRFVVGCLIEFLGVYLITSDRRQLELTWETKSAPNMQCCIDSEIEQARSLLHDDQLSTIDNSNVCDTLDTNKGEQKPDHPSIDYYDGSAC